MRVLLVVGTRPEGIKMLPLFIELKKIKEFEVVLCTTGQHPNMLNEILSFFKVKPDYSFNAMKKGQGLNELTVKLLNYFDVLLNDVKPDLVLVHGDTTSAFCAALSSFYKGIKIAHIEAGLRTFDKYAPYPEEFNRVAIDAISDLHFAPTSMSANQLIKEGRNNVFTVGNTVLDAFSYTLDLNYSLEKIGVPNDKKIVLITTHRRENIGVKMKSALLGIRDILFKRKDVFALFPIHPNPSVVGVANEVFCGIKNIKMCNPLPVYDFHNILSKAFAIITDSGGAQEEASFLGIPIFLLRDKTERKEGIESGNIRLVGTNRENVSSEFLSVLNDEKSFEKMRQKTTVFGCGDSSIKIAKILFKLFL